MGQTPERARDLWNASFRGVPFSVDQVSGEYGRDVTPHEIAFSDTQIEEDKRRFPREWEFDAWVCGADWLKRGNELIAALETAGPGLLVHPVHGIVSVVLAGKGRATITKGAIGRWDFKLHFREAADDAVQLGTYKVPAAPGKNLLEKAAAAFAAGYDAISRGYQTIASAIADTTDRVERVTDVVRKYGDPALIGRVSAATHALTASIRTLLSTPDRLAAQWQAIFEDMGQDIARTLGGEMSPLLDASTAAAAATGMTPTEQQARDNTAALDRLLLATVTAWAAEGAAVAEYATYDDGARVRDELAALLATLASRTDAPDEYAALVDQRGRLVDALARGLLDLPRLRTLVLTSTWSCVDLAIALYGDPTRADEIRGRNEIEQPDFVTGSIVVLTA